MIRLPSGNFLISSVNELPNFTNAQDLFMDFETRSGTPERGGIRPYHGDRIAGIAVTADEEKSAFYVPIRHNNSPANLELEPVLRWMGDVLKTSKDWVNHNVKFDAHFAAVDGCEFGGRLVDTLTLAKIHYSDSISYGLKGLCRDWLGMEMGESLKLKAFLKAIQSKDFADAPADIVGDYACEDVQSNRALYRFLQEKRDPGVAKVWETEIALTPVLFDMERTGMPVEPFELDKEHFKVLNSVIRYSSELHDLLGYELNPRSPPQVYDLFVNQMGLPILAYKPIKDKTTGRFSHGNPTFDKKAMKLYQSHPLVLGDPKKRRIVELLGLYREEAQYLSLFIETYKELQIDGILHPSYNQAVRTGRMSCSSPNAQQLNKRAKKLIHPLKGEGMLSYDYCLTGETEIITEFGNMSIKEVCEKRPAVLAVQRSERQTVGTVKFRKTLKGAKIGYAPVYKITLEDGSVVRSSSDHQWMKFEGGWILTKDLVPGTRLSHVKEGMVGRYPTWALGSLTSGQWKHKAIADFKFGSIPYGMDIHHIDHNVHNWVNSNIELKEFSENRAEAAQSWWGNATEEERKAKLASLVAGIERRRSYEGDENPNYTGAGYDDECSVCGRKFRVYMQSSSARWAGFCTRKCQGLPTNHRVVSVEPDGWDDIYQITVDDLHNYVLANGLVSRNSQVEYRLIVHYIKDPAAIAAYAANPETDFHQFVADQCGINRKQAKNLNFAMGYGAGKAKVLSMLASDPTLTADMTQKFLTGDNIDLAAATVAYSREMQSRSLHIYNNYHERLPGLRLTTRAAMDTAKMRGYVFNAYGRRRHLQSNFAHRAFNSIIQPCAADVMKERLVAIAPRYNSKIRNAGLRIMANVHDETVFRGPKEAIIDHEMQKYIKDTLQDTDVKFRVPILVGGGVSLENWSEASGDKPTTNDDGIGGPIEWETESVGDESEESGIGFE